MFAFKYLTNHKLSQEFTRAVTKVILVQSCELMSFSPSIQILYGGENSDRLATWNSYNSSCGRVILTKPIVIDSVGKHENIWKIS